MARLSGLGVGVLGLLLALFSVSALASDELTRIQAPGFRYAYAAGGALPTGFNSVYIAPVRGPDDVGPRDQRTMQNYLEEQLERSLGRHFRLANGPNGNVLTVEARFTTLQSNRVTNEQAGKNPNIDVARSVAVGRAGIAITLRDGSGRILATLEDERTGLPLEQNPHLDSQWGDAMSFSRQWAESLADNLS